MITSIGAGYALVTVPPVPDWNTSAGGGPISKSVGLTVPAHAGTFVQRTPHNVVVEGEPGARWPVDIAATMMFIPDGRLAPAQPYAYDQFSGAFGDVQPIVVQQPRAIRPAFIAMLIGAGAGGAMTRDHRIAGTIGGAIVGGMLGLFFG